jgi:hypothetical protein
VWFFLRVKTSRVPRLLQAFSRLDLAAMLAVLGLLTFLALPVVAAIPPRR